MELKVSVYSNFSELPDGLVRESSYPQQPEFLLSVDWYRCLYDTSFGAEWVPHIYSVYNQQDRPLLLLFCCRKRGIRVLKGLTNFYTTLFEPGMYCDSAELHNAYGALAEFIANERPRWSSVELRFLPAGYRESHPLLAQIQQNGFVTYRYFQFENWYLRTNHQSFESYYRSLSSRTRNTIRRKENKTKKSHKIDVRIYHKSHDDIDQAIADYVAVYNKSWKKPEPHNEFIPTLIKLCADLGILRLGLLYLDHSPVAAQLWIVSGSKALIYKLAYDEEYKHLSPGSILSKALFCRVITQDSPVEIDYGVGSENYKKDWMTSIRNVYGWQAYNIRTVSGFLLAVIHVLKRLIRPKTTE